MAEYKIREYENGDEISINKGFNEVFHQKRSLEEWLWKFNPDENRSAIMVAVDSDNNVLAHYAATITELSAYGKTYNCGQVLDLFSIKGSASVRYRLFIKMGNEFYKRFGERGDIDIFYGLPSMRSFKLGQLKIGYGNFRQVEIAERFIENPRYIFRKAPRSEECDPDAVENLWTRASQRYPLGTRRDAEYIKRRYLSHPTKKYVFLSVNKGGNLMAFAVLEYVKKISLKCVELIWDGQDIADIETLEGKLCRMAARAGIKKIELWLHNDDAAKSILTNKKWVFAQHDDICLACRSYMPNLDSDTFINDFYLTMGDSDLV